MSILQRKYTAVYHKLKEEWTKRIFVLDGGMVRLRARLLRR